MLFKLLCSVLTAASVSGGTEIGLVSFSEEDGYTNGVAVANGPIASSGFSFASSALADCFVTAVVSNETLVVSETYQSPATQAKASAWVKDTDPTAFADMEERWGRAVDVKLDPATGTGGKVNVALVNGSIGNSSSINWTQYADGYFLEVSFSKYSDTQGQFMIRRKNSSDANESYDFSSETWTTTTDYFLYDISHEMTVFYICDPNASSNHFRVAVVDGAAESNLVDIVMDSNTVTETAGGTNTVRFVAGDLWENSGHDTFFSLGHAKESFDYILSFRKEDGYTSGTVVTSGPLGDSGFSYSSAALSGSSVSATITNEMLLVDEDGSPAMAAAWIKDTEPTAFSDMDDAWYRAVDVHLDPASGSGGKVNVSLINGTIGGGSSIGWTEYDANYFLEVSFSKNSETNGQFFVRRKNDAGTNEKYQFSSATWSSTTDYHVYDISHEINVLYGCFPDAASNQFALLIYDVTDDSVLHYITCNTEDMTDAAGGTNTVRFAAGDLWANSGHDTLFSLGHEVVTVLADDGSSVQLTPNTVPIPVGLSAMLRAAQTFTGTEVATRNLTNICNNAFIQSIALGITWSDMQPGSNAPPSGAVLSNVVARLEAAEAVAGRAEPIPIILKCYFYKLPDWLICPETASLSEPTVLTNSLGMTVIGCPTYTNASGGVVPAEDVPISTDSGYHTQLTNLMAVVDVALQSLDPDGERFCAIHCVGPAMTSVQMRAPETLVEYFPNIGTSSLVSSWTKTNHIQAWADMMGHMADFESFRSRAWVFDFTNLQGVSGQMSLTTADQTTVFEALQAAHPDGAKAVIAKTESFCVDFNHRLTSTAEAATYSAEYEPNGLSTFRYKLLNTAVSIPYQYISEQLFLHAWEDWSGLNHNADLRAPSMYPFYALIENSLYMYPNVLVRPVPQGTIWVEIWAQESAYPDICTRFDNSTEALSETLTRWDQRLREEMLRAYEERR